MSLNDEMLPAGLDHFLNCGDSLVEHMDRMSRCLIKMTAELQDHERHAILSHQWRLEAMLIDLGVLPAVFEPRYLASQFGTAVNRPGAMPAGHRSVA